MSKCGGSRAKACIAGLYIGIPLHNPIILENDCAFVVATLATENLLGNIAEF